MTNNGKICKNCGHEYWDWDICCQKPLFDFQKRKQKPEKILKKIKKLSDINPYCLDICLEDMVRLVDTIQQINELCKEVKDE